MPFEQYITLSQEAFYHNKDKLNQAKTMAIGLRGGETLYGCSIQNLMDILRAYYFEIIRNQK